MSQFYTQRGLTAEPPPLVVHWRACQSPWHINEQTKNKVKLFTVSKFLQNRACNPPQYYSLMLFIFIDTTWPFLLVPQTSHISQTPVKQTINCFVWIIGSWPWWLIVPSSLLPIKCVTVFRKLRNREKKLSILYTRFCLKRQAPSNHKLLVICSHEKNNEKFITELHKI